MPSEFVVLKNGKLEKYNNFEDIPQKFQHLIKFLPETPDGPHTEEQHKEIESWNDKLKELMNREKNTNRK